MFMILRKWEDLPAEMQIPEVKVYYDILQKKKIEPCSEKTVRYNGFVPYAPFPFTHFPFSRNRNQT